MTHQFWPPPLLIDLFRIIGRIRQKPIRLLKNGLPGKRDMKALNQLLLAPLDIDETAQFSQSGYLLFLYEIGYQLDFLTERDGHIHPSLDTIEAFAECTPFQQQQQMLEAYTGMVLWDETRQLDELTFHFPDEIEPDALPIGTVQQARKSILAWLQHLPEETQREPFTERELLEQWRIQHPDLLSLATPLHDTYINVLLQQNGSLTQAKHPDDWMQIEGQFLSRVLHTSLRWLGCVQQVPGTEDTTFQIADTWFAQELIPSAIQYPSEMIVQANLDIMLFPGRDQLTLVNHIEAFCKPIDGERILRYHIDKKRFFAALQKGLSFEQILHLLEQHSRTPLPSNIAQLLQSWHQQSSQIIISKRGAVLETSTETELLQLLQKWPDTIPYSILNTQSIFVPFHGHKALKQWLKQQPPIPEIDLERRPPQCLTIHADLRVTLQPPADLLVKPLLERVSTRTHKKKQPANTYFITQESLQLAIEQGLSFDEIVDFLESRAKVFSSTARLRLEAFANQIGNVFLGEAVVLATEDPDTMDRLFHEGGLSQTLTRLGPTVALAPANKRKEAEALLQSVSLPNQPTLQTVLQSQDEENT
jgi:hypothetical protein